MSFLYRLKLFVYFSNFSLLFFKVVDFFRIFFHSELPLDQIQTTRRFRNREEWDGARLEKSWEHWSIVSSCLNIPISKEKYTKEASGQSHGKSKKFNKLRCLVWLNYKKYIYIYIYKCCSILNIFLHKLSLKKSRTFRKIKSNQSNYVIPKSQKSKIWNIKFYLSSINRFKWSFLNSLLFAAIFLSAVKNVKDKVTKIPVILADILKEFYNRKTNQNFQYLVFYTNNRCCFLMVQKITLWILWIPWIYFRTFSFSPSQS